MNNKAWVATALGALGAFGTALLTVWTDTDPLTARDLVVAAVAAITTGGITGGAVWNTSNA